MTIEDKTKWLFAANAVINWSISIRGIVDPAGMATSFGGQVPSYPFMLRLWMGFVFMFGCMFWEVSRDVRRKAALMKYNWIEKTITALAVTYGFVLGEVPGILMVMIVLTNWLWIPFILYADIMVRRNMKARAR